MPSSTFSANSAGELTNEAVLVFEHRADRGVTALLRPGFRHCFCLLRHPPGWALCDPLKNALRFEFVANYSATDLADQLSGQNRAIVHVRYAPPVLAGGAALRPLTCVEITKRILGLRAPWVFTPYQLFRHLVRRDQHDRFAVVGVSIGLDSRSVRI